MEQKREMLDVRCECWRMIDWVLKLQASNAVFDSK